MSPLVRTLTVVVGVLIGLSGGGVVLVQTTSGAPKAAGADTGRPANPATTSTSPGDATSTIPRTVAPRPRPTTPTTVVRTTTTVPLPPLTVLTRSLDGAMAGSNSCLIVENVARQPLYQYQPDTPLIPASTQKLLVAAAALMTLGPNYRFTTQVVASAPPVNGTVAGLWLVGHGDPLLATPEFVASQVGRARAAGYPWTPLSSLADQLVAAGVRTVSGGIRGDDHYEDQLRTLPVWPAEYQQQLQVGMLSALSVNEGIQFTPTMSTLAQDPPNYAASELARLLQLRQVPAGSVADQVAPASAVVLASVMSAPVGQMVEAMLRASDNWIAELLTRAIDKVSGGTGTTAGGAAIVLRDAAQSGIPVDGVQMDDGSGLSRTDRASCRELLAALDLGNQPAFAPIMDGLAVAGQTGTLAARYGGTALAGRLRAKTGSLPGVGGMIGVLSAPTTEHFALLDNDSVSETALFAKEDAVAGAIGAYSARA